MYVHFHVAADCIECADELSVFPSLVLDSRNVGEAFVHHFLGHIAVLSVVDALKILEVVCFRYATHHAYKAAAAILNLRILTVLVDALLSGAATGGFASDGFHDIWGVIGKRLRERIAECSVIIAGQEFVCLPRARAVCFFAERPVRVPVVEKVHCGVHDSGLCRCVPPKFSALGPGRISGGACSESQSQSCAYVLVECVVPSALHLSLPAGGVNVVPLPFLEQVCKGVVLATGARVEVTGGRIGVLSHYS